MLMPYLLANVAVAAVYGFDKLAARHRLRRIPESFLLVSAVVGGLGALCAVFLLRHKSSKSRFLIPLGLAVFAHLGFLYIFKFQPFG